MHPILFRIPVPNWSIPGVGPLHEVFVQGSIPIYSYGVMLGLSLVIGWYLTLTLAARDGLPKETMANCYVVTALAALIGSRLLYVLTNMSEFHSLGDVFAFRNGGLVAYGGFLGGYLGSWGYLKSKRIALMPWADVAVPSLASGLAVTRIGCYLFGCDFGKPLSDGAPDVLKKLGTFPHWEAGLVDRGDGAPAWVQHLNAGLIDRTAEHSLAVHPTQLYESLVGVALLALLLWQRKHQRFRGQVFLLFAFSYGFIRFLLELVRDDAERGEFGPSLPAHVLIGACLVVFAVAYSIGFANAIANKSVRIVTQIASFVPAVVAFLVMKPGSFAYAPAVQLSTSQWVGLLTAVASGIAFMVFWKAAQVHPKQAMVINLEGFYALEALKTKSVADDSSDDEGDDDDADAAKTDDDKPSTSSTKRKKKKAKSKSNAGQVVDAHFDDEASEQTPDSHDDPSDRSDSQPDEHRDDDSEEDDADSEDEQNSGENRENEDDEKGDESTSDGSSTANDEAADDADADDEAADDADADDANTDDEAADDADADDDTPKDSQR